MKTLTAVLFAGGESRRMGADKAAVILDGEPLWARQLRTLRGLGPEKVLISARAKPAWSPPEMEVILDEPPSRGPLSGLAATLRNIRTTHLLALAIDLPQMTASHLNKLWTLARPGIGVVPRNGEFFEPLSAIYPVEGLSAAEDSLADADVSLHGYIRKLAARKQVRFHPISQGEAANYRNANTPEELLA
jgi:molybdopterin-guanine dinucleotide biosynthesis protein A